MKHDIVILDCVSPILIEKLFHTQRKQVSFLGISAKPFHGVLWKWSEEGTGRNRN